MLSSNIILAVSALAGFAAAQASPPPGPYTVDPNTIDYPLRQAWCRSQQNLCPMICGGSANPNTCDPNSLQWTCTCANGQAANISSYKDTVPYYQCAAYRDQCVMRAPNDLATQSSCLAVPCGNATVGSVVTTTRIASMSANGTSSAAAASGSSSAASSSRSASASTTGAVGSATSAAASAGGAATSAVGSAAGAATSAVTGKSAATMLQLGYSYGTGVVAMGLLALFGLAL